MGGTMKKVFLSAVGLLLLVVSSISLWSPAAAKQAVPMKGSEDIVVTMTPDFPNMKIYVQGYGTGTATHLGKFTVQYDIVQDLQTQIGSGTVIFTAANGHQLFTDNTGTVTPTGNPNENRVDMTYVITGGTGRFEGASGQFSGIRLVNIVTGLSTASFSGEIVLP
jgi:hypothetical protein